MVPVVLLLRQIQHSCSWIVTALSSSRTGRFSLTTVQSPVPAGCLFLPLPSCSTSPGIKPMWGQQPGGLYSLCMEETNTRNDHGHLSPLGSSQTPFIPQQLLHQGDAKGNERTVPLQLRRLLWHGMPNSIGGLSVYQCWALLVLGKT